MYMIIMNKYKIPEMQYMNYEILTVFNIHFSLIRTGIKTPEATRNLLSKFLSFHCFQHKKRYHDEISNINKVLIAC